MVDFTISTIRIKNFKGMRDFKISVPMGKLVTIIGQNNSGKSNLLEAIVLCLSPKEFSSHQIKETDFWHDKNGMAAEFFDIEVIFAATVGAKLPMLRDINGTQVEVKGIRLYAEIDNLESDQYLIDEKGERIFWGRKYATPKDIEQWLPEIWYLSPSNLEKDFKEWKNGYMRRLLKNYKEDFLSNSATDLIKEYKELCENKLQTKYWKDKVEPKLKKEMSFFNGNSDRPIIRPGLKDLDIWFWEGLVVSIMPEDEWPIINHKQLGKGWQSLLRLVSLNGARNITEKGKKVLVCIDEPEAYLTPFKQRKLCQYLGAMIKKSDQVMMATHSNNMLSDKTSQKLVRLKMTKKGVEKNEFEGKIPESIFKCNSEIFFGSSVIFDLTKGSEEWEEEIDWDANEAVLIKNKKIDEVKQITSFIQSLGISWCVISENDEEVSVLEKQQSLYDKVIDIRKNREIGQCVETWLEKEWCNKETLILR